VNDVTCGTCGFKLWLPVARLQVATLGLYDDARFPGRALLMFDDHVEHLEDVSPEQACAFLEDARAAARAIKLTARSPRVNYAVLGNTQPHLHWHLIPRQPRSEPAPQRPPWEDPRPLEPLGADDVTRFLERLRDALH
jgi:diadenosine tetraphosphate (Ap4A) HIT family hydrolase